MTPKDGSLADKTIGYLEINGGRLTPQDIADKLGADPSTVSNKLRAALKAGLLVREKEGRRAFYSLGKK